LGYTIVGLIAVPYIPKTFYSIPSPGIRLLEMSKIDLESYISAEMAKRFHEDLVDRMINGDPTFYSEFGEPIGVLSVSDDQLAG